MRYLAICLNTDFCGWSTELSQEEYASFDFSCPECFHTCVTYNETPFNNNREEILGFLLPLIVGEVGDSEESMDRIFNDSEKSSNQDQ